MESKMSEIRKYTSDAARREIAFISGINQIYTMPKVSINSDNSYLRTSSPLTRTWKPSTSRNSRILDNPAYKRFSLLLEQPPKRIVVLGIGTPLKGIVSGHLVPFINASIIIEDAEEVLECPVAEADIGFSENLQPIFKRIFKTLFTNIFKLCRKENEPCLGVKLNPSFLSCQNKEQLFL